MEGAAYPPEAGMQKIFAAYEKDKVADFNAAVAEYKEKYAAGLADTEKAKVGLEARMNHFDPFLQCMVLYLAVAVLAALSWLVWREPLRRAAFGLALLTLAVHTVALGARMYIGNRPPVTNLYSSAVFIGWGSLALCLVLERIYKLGVGAFAGGLIGFATLYIARFLAESGDTLEMLQAVLDTNFWLATHVTCVTLGYVTTLVGGVLGLVYIVGGMFTNGLRGEAGKQVAGMMYGSLCFATLMSFTGTVLGGIWADQSWGRFWGWDPKENGAVLVVIWNALILHARWAGLVKARGMAVLAVIGCMWTVWSWFGTNQLGIGLHAYGFDNRLANGCAITWIALGLVAGLGMVPPRFWASLGPAPQARTA
jgi:ABC-type transport system involved in cytochrome c biogenesis permease subunit